MITKEQYIEAKKIVDEYELAELEQGEREADYDINLDNEDDGQEHGCGYCGAAECWCSEWELCHCGAYVNSQKLGRIIRVSDCIC